jgi:protein-S-isoprenylcysteine O-methyltransferase Ste14
MIGAMLYFLRVNPDMFAVRSRVHPGTKHWDKVVVGFLLLGILAIPPVAGVDDGRFHWSKMSCSLVALGYVFLIAGWILIAWAETVNPFFEPGVRIQTERGHYVIDTGPYSIVRHPGCIISPLHRLCLVAGLLVGLDSGGLCIAGARAANVIGRTDVACGIGGICSSRATGSLAIDSRRVVA